MKKILAGILSAVMLITFSGCGNKTGGTSESLSGGTSENISESTGDAPGALDENGDINMEVALKYQTDYDALEKALNEREVDVNQPVSLNARNNPKTMKIWSLLRENYGKKIFSAQQQMDLVHTYEDKVYYNALEDLPAIKGFDFIFSTGSKPDRGFVDAALDWGTKSGGLVTFCWHWKVPRDIDKPDNGIAFYMSSDGVKITNFNARNASTPGTKEYEYIIHDIDLIANYLRELEQAGITVLWRPFHEAEGSWFWWGMQDKSEEASETYRRLWYLMFDRLENYHKLSNLIWVWNGESEKLTVNPNTYDISGKDYYAQSEDHSSLGDVYDSLKSYTYDGKMLALTETGYLPDPQQCVDDGKMWLYYMPWNGGFIYEPGDKTNLNSSPVTDLYGTPSPNPERLSNELLKEYFGNDVLVSWNDLPDITEMPYGEHNIPQAIKTWQFMKNQESDL